MDKYTTILSIPNLDELTVSDARTLFLGYKSQGVILHGDFEDDRWFLSDEYRNVTLDFSQPKQNLMPEDEFKDCFKAYIIYNMGVLSLLSLQSIVNTIKDVTEDSPNLKKAIEFFSMLPCEPYEYVAKLEKMEDEAILKPKSQRKLASFQSYFMFDDILKRWWKEATDEFEKLFFFPIYLWWHVTGVLPTRPKEFLVTPRKCLTCINGKWMLAVRKDKLKGRNKKNSYKIAEDFTIKRYEIPENLARDIQWYLDKTEDFIPTELDTLFRTDSHYAKWDRTKPYRSRYYTYANLATCLRYFYNLIISEKYGYNVVFDTTVLGDNDIEYLHLGDTRHLTLINVIAEGGTPAVAMILAGHDNPEMSSHYYTNIANLIECRTYRMYKAMITGNQEYSLSKPIHPLKVSGYTEIDGGLCYSPNVKDGVYIDCVKACGPTGEIGYCKKCTYFRASGAKFSASKDAYVNEIKTDCKNLENIIKRVRLDKGSTEEILEALMQLKASEYSYQQYLLEVEYGENGNS